MIHYAVLNAASPSLNRLDAVFTTLSAQAAYYARCLRLGRIMALRNHQSYASWAFKGY